MRLIQNYRSGITQSQWPTCTMYVPLFLALVPLQNIHVDFSNGSALCKIKTALPFQKTGRIDL